MKAIKQYLSRYAEPEAALVSKLSLPTLQHCLIIPAFDEQDSFFSRLSPLFKSQNILIIIVINQPDTIKQPTAANLTLFESLQNQTRLQCSHQHLQLRQIPNSGSFLLLIDRFNQGSKIAAKKGVGLARKIAADIAALLIDQEIISTPWIYSTDCDAHLPDNYFQHSTVAKNSSALIFPFQHITASDSLGQATKLYEFSLHYYQQGLAFAKSPYAYHSIGSTIAPHATAYCQARGFPQKSGGEDFYLLNKLAKIGPITSLKKPYIQIEARKSHRVPFGTGPAVETIMSQQNSAQHFTVYDPQVFTHLKELLELFPHFFQQDAEVTLRELPPLPSTVIMDMGIIKAIAQANQLTLSSGNKEHFLRHLHSWFDAFRTLKFIHALRNHGLHNVVASNLNTEENA